MLSELDMQVIASRISKAVRSYKRKESVKNYVASKHVIPESTDYEVQSVISYYLNK